MRVSSLTVALTLSLLWTGCSYLGLEPDRYSDPSEQQRYEQSYVDQCNSHAYIRTVLSDYISNRFPSGAQVRTAVVPFSTPANLAESSIEHPGLGAALARTVQASLLETNALSIVEIFNRQDWPGKKEEFHSGNFGAIAFAREAGYDLVIVGLVEPPNSIRSLSAQAKVIETESGITLWYGRAKVEHKETSWDGFKDWLTFTDKVPAKLNYSQITEQVARCLAYEIASESY